MLFALKNQNREQIGQHPGNPVPQLISLILVRVITLFVQILHVK